MCPFAYFELNTVDVSSVVCHPRYSMTHHSNPAPSTPVFARVVVSAAGFDGKILMPSLFLNASPVRSSKYSNMRAPCCRPTVGMLVSTVGSVYAYSGLLTFRRVDQKGNTPYVPGMYLHIYLASLGQTLRPILRNHNEKHGRLSEINFYPKEEPTAHLAASNTLLCAPERAFHAAGCERRVASGAIVPVGQRAVQTALCCVA